MNMNLQNRLGRLVLSIIGASVLLSFSGCDLLENPEGPVQENDAVITLRLDEAFQTKAYVRLNHDGAQEDFWYYMLTQDFDADAKKLLEDQIQQDLKADSLLVGNVGTNKNITLNDLQPKTSYRVIAARILSTGKITGEVAELTFVTLRDPSKFEVNPEWQIVYKGREADKEDENLDVEVFACTVGESAESYVPCVITKEDFSVYYDEDHRKCFEDYVAFRNAENVKWPNVILTEDYEHIENRLRHDDYILFMVGVDASGELTGYYAQTECKIEQEVATDAYRKWIGKWTLKGKCNGKDITYQVEISPEENNLYYRMSGWESTTASDYFEGLPSLLPICLWFEKSTGNAYVVSEAFPDLEDPMMAEMYDFYLYGCVNIEYNGEMSDMVIVADNVKIAKFVLTSDSRAVAYPEKSEFYDSTGARYEEPFAYFNYSYIIAEIYDGLVPVTTDMLVPRIDTITLER